MISNSPNQDFIRVVSRQETSSSIEKFWDNLSLGQVLNGKVVEVRPDGKALLDFHSRKLLVESEVPLSKDQKIFAKVDTLKPHTILKLIPPKHSTNFTKSKAYPTSDGPQGVSRIGNSTYQSQVPILNNETIAEFKFAPGETFQAVVNRLFDGIAEVKYEGRILLAQLEPNETLPKIGEEITLQMRRSEKGLYLVSRSLKLKEFDPGLLKSYLAAKRDFGAMVSYLEKNVLN